jgi:hypothetical protein
MIERIREAKQQSTRLDFKEFLLSGPGLGKLKMRRSRERVRAIDFDSLGKTRPAGIAIASPPHSSWRR